MIFSGLGKSLLAEVSMDDSLFKTLQAIMDNASNLNNDITADTAPIIFLRHTYAHNIETLLRQWKSFELESHNKASVINLIQPKSLEKQVTLDDVKDQYSLTSLTKLQMKLTLGSEVNMRLPMLMRLNINLHRFDMKTADKRLEFSGFKKIPSDIIVDLPFRFQYL
ncbi:hypothetical protein BGZ76_008970 [Entomortierella beljakovae]|nr:hypothetical protein BGZ76_008970 [Entomortierella beljakovae]